ncbi:enoyl-CoA hydratase/isomerase family protein [Catenulispora subtropica]|uniref:Enoyl-CoA hydratase-related protein n=1 Tax=Catenulispora subtropica TaxID=450798 RepID=A0ABP5DC07_9ACTN
MFRTGPAVAEAEWQLRLEVGDDGVATLVLDRPEKLNAWSWEASRQLARLAPRIRFDERIRVLVVRGTGRAFCAGVDLGLPEDRITGRSAAERARNFAEGLRWVHEQFRAFAALPQPIIAAVHGYCLGFGFELALMCDLRVASADAVFALPEAQIGMAVDAGGEMRLARDAGSGWAKLLALTGRRIDAATAARIGVVQEVTPPEELLPTAYALAAEIAANAPLAVQAIKRSVDAFADRGLTEAMNQAALFAATTFISEDAPLGYAAKAERRAAEFEGK